MKLSTLVQTNSLYNEVHPQSWSYNFIKIKTSCTEVHPEYLSYTLIHLYTNSTVCVKHFHSSQHKLSQCKSYICFHSANFQQYMSYILVQLFIRHERKIFTLNLCNVLYMSVLFRCCFHFLLHLKGLMVSEHKYIPDEEIKLEHQSTLFWIH